MVAQFQLFTRTAKTWGFIQIRSAIGAEYHSSRSREFLENENVQAEAAVWNDLMNRANYIAFLKLVWINPGKCELFM